MPRIGGVGRIKGGLAAAVVALTAFAGTTPAHGAFSFIAEWGAFGTGDGQFYSPEGIATDASGNVYVVEFFNHRVQKFDPNGNFILKWGQNGSLPGQFANPADVAVDPAGNVYVADWANQRIQKFDSAGNFILEWGQFGTAPGEFQGPRGVATDAAGNVYVAEQDGDRVQKFTSAGQFLAQVGTSGAGPGQLDSPLKLAVDAAGNIFVADAGNDRVQKFGPDGAFLAQWGAAGTGPAPTGGGGPPDPSVLSPFGIAADPWGRLYVGDRENDRVLVFDTDGQLLSSFGSPGTGSGQFGSPYGIAISASGYVYVIDNGNSRIERFGYPGLLFEATAKKRQALGKLKLAGVCPEEECTFSAKGKAVAGSEKAKLKRREKTVDPGESETLRLKLKGRGARRELADALDEGAKGKVKVVVDAVDLAGETGKEKLKLKLKD